MKISNSVGVFNHFSTVSRCSQRKMPVKIYRYKHETEQNRKTLSRWAISTGKRTDIKWLAVVWLLAGMRGIVLCNFRNKTMQRHLLCLILAFAVNHPYWACAYPSSPQDFKGPYPGTLYCSHFSSTSQESNKLDLLYISAFLSSYYFLNTAGAVFFHIYKLWDIATISEILTLVITQ